MRLVKRAQSQVYAADGDLTTAVCSRAANYKAPAAYTRKEGYRVVIILFLGGASCSVRCEWKKMAKAH